MNAGISVVSLCAALGMGHGPLTLAVFHLIAAPFFTSMWEEYHTGILRTGNVLYGVTEGQFVSCAINLLTATLGAAAADPCPTPHTTLVTPCTSEQASAGGACLC